MKLFILIIKEDVICTSHSYIKKNTNKKKELLKVNSSNQSPVQFEKNVCFVFLIYHLEKSLVVLRLQGAAGSLRQIQKASSSNGNDAGSGWSGVIPTWFKFH